MIILPGRYEPTGENLTRSLRAVPLLSLFVLCVLLAPSSIAVGSGELDATAGNGYVDLNWHTIDNATRYNVYRGSGATDMELIANVTAPITAYHDGDLNGGDTFIYYVTAVDTGGEGAPSDSVSVTVPEEADNDMIIPILAIVISAIALQASVIVLLYLFRVKMK